MYFTKKELKDKGFNEAQIKRFQELSRNLFKSFQRIKKTKVFLQKVLTEYTPSWFIKKLLPDCFENVPILENKLLASLIYDLLEVEKKYKDK
jgi:hypothetical protein